MSLFLVVLHPVEYQIPFYNALSKILDDDLLVTFMDDFTTKPYSTNSWGKDYLLPVRSANKPTNYGFRYMFSKNLSPFRNHFLFNRINLDIIFRILKDKPDLVLITGYTSITSIILLILNKFIKSSICLRAEGGIKDKLHKKRQPRIISYLIKLLVTRADYFFYSCDDNRRLYIERGFTPRRLFPLLSSVDNDYFANKVEIDDISFYSNPYFLVASKLERRKNIVETIQGFLQYKKSSSCNVLDQLVIAGIGDSEDELMAAAGGRHDIIFHGYCNDKDDMRTLIQHAKGIVLSSFIDPSPKILNEAVACSKAILCSNSVGTSGDLVDHMSNGYVYELSNLYDLACGYDWINLNFNNPIIQQVSHQKVKIWSPEANALSVKKVYDLVRR